MRGSVRHPVAAVAMECEGTAVAHHSYGAPFSHTGMCGMGKSVVREEAAMSM